MKVTMDTRDFVDALKRVLPVCPPKPSLPVLNGVCLTVQKDSCRLTGTNLEQWLTVTLPAGKTRPGSVVLPEPKKLLGVCKHLSDNFLTITQAEADAGTLTITCGDKQLEYPAATGDFEPPAMEVSEAYTAAAESLCSRARRIQYAVSGDERPACAGIHFSGSEMVAVNGYQLAANRDEAFSVGTPFTVPLAAITLAGKALRGQVTLCKDNQYLVLIDGDTSLQTKLLTDPFPKYEDFFDILGESFTVSKTDLLSAANFLAAAAGKQNAIIRWEKDDFHLQGTNTKVKVPMAYPYEKIWGYVAKNLIQALEQCCTEELCLTVSSRQFHLKLTDGEGNRALMTPYPLRP